MRISDGRRSPSLRRRRRGKRGVRRPYRRSWPRRSVARGLAALRPVARSITRHSANRRRGRFDMRSKLAEGWCRPDERSRHLTLRAICRACAECYLYAADRTRILHPGYGGRAPSANDREQAAAAHRPRPAPHLPSMRAVTDREEDDLGAADDILERHIADPAPRRRHFAVVGVVTVVAHHEEMPGRHYVGRCVVVLGILDAIERLVA